MECRTSPATTTTTTTIRNNNTSRRGANVSLLVALLAVGSSSLRSAEASGADHTCVVTDTAAAKCWGGNNAGQCGVEPSEVDQSMTELTQDDGFELLQLSVGPQITCGVFYNAATSDVSDTRVKCWGQNYGGSGYADADLQPWTASLDSMDVETCTGLGCSAPSVVQVAVGGSHICALNDERNVKCWGQNTYGQLGYGDTLSRGGSPFMQSDDVAAALEDVPAVDLGTYQELNLAGTYGDPVQVGALQICAGYDHTCAVVLNLESSFTEPAATHRYVKCWGRNNYGQLGLGDVANRGDDPFEMGNNLTFVDLDATGEGWIPKNVACGRDHTCVLFENGRVSCWGSNELGALGSTAGTTRFSASRVRVGDQPAEMGSNLELVDLGTDENGEDLLAVSISADYGRSCAVLHNGTAKCWGANELHCGYDDARGLLGGAYGRGGTQTNINKYIGDGDDEMGSDLSTLFFENPSNVKGNESTVSVAQISIERCHTCALLLPATCSDGIKNQGELMVDCGGSNCDPCEATEAAAEASCDPTCFDRPPRSQLDYCLFSSFASVAAGCAASPVGYCDATCGVCAACPRSKQPPAGRVECFGINYLGQLGLSTLRSGDNFAYGDDYNEKLFSGNRALLDGEVAQLPCSRGLADSCGCEDGFRGIACDEVVDVCDEGPCMFGARCYTYFPVVNPVSGKSRERFACDCDTALVDDVGGTRCQIDLAPPTLSCGTALPVALSGNFIANYTFLQDNFLQSGYFCADDSGDFFPTDFDSNGNPDCGSATATAWMTDNVGLQSVVVTPTNPVDVCTNNAFKAAASGHATFCSSGPGSVDDPLLYFWGEPGNVATASITATDLSGQTASCDISLYPSDLTAPTASCVDLDLTDDAVVDPRTGLLTWNVSLVTDGAPLQYSDPDLFGGCTATDDVSLGVQSVDVLASTGWSQCGSTTFASFTRVDGASGDASFDSVLEDCAEVTYHTVDSAGGTPHTTGLSMFAKPYDRFGNDAVGFVGFKVYLYDTVDPTVSCPSSAVSVTSADAASVGASCVFSPSLVSAADADSGVAQIVFTENGSGSAIGTWTANSATGTCDGGDLVLDATFATTLAGLGSLTAFNVDAVVSDAGLVDADARTSSAVTCTNFAVSVSV